SSMVEKFCPTKEIQPVPLYWIEFTLLAPVALSAAARTALASCAAAPPNNSAGTTSAGTNRNPNLLRIKPSCLEACKILTSRRFEPQSLSLVLGLTERRGDLGLL